MKKLFFPLAVVLCGGLLTGCATNFHKSLKALANDPAEIDIVVNSPWGNQEFHRRMPTNWQRVIYVTNGVPIK